MVRRGQGEQIDDQQQVVIVRLTRRLVVPAHDEPENQRDGEQAQRIDLLVDDRLIPHGERGGGNDRPGERRQAAWPQRRHERAQPALGDEEPAPRRDRARHGREQIDSLRVGVGERQQSPHVRHEHEERIARRVRNAERVRRGDVFGRIPELRRRGQGEDVEYQCAQGDTSRHQVRRLDGAQRRTGCRDGSCRWRGAIGIGGRHRPV